MDRDVVYETNDYGLGSEKSVKEVITHWSYLRLVYILSEEAWNDISAYGITKIRHFNPYREHKFDDVRFDGKKGVKFNKKLIKGMAKVNELLVHPGKKVLQGWEEERRARWWKEYKEKNFPKPKQDVPEF